MIIFFDILAKVWYNQIKTIKPLPKYMIVTIVHVKVKPEHIQDFIAATQLNHQNSIQEVENMRFDVLQDPKDESKFILYEAYRTEEGAKIHKETAHYLTWRETVADWMA
ncbi:MAG TPA: antibiotic biosynthesis monooxygenase, partial [Allocoleopsis sp.]